MTTMNVPRVGANLSVQAPGGPVSLAKIVENRMKDGILMTLVHWIDIRREDEWVPALTVPPELNHGGR